MASLLLVAMPGAPRQWPQIECHDSKGNTCLDSVQELVEEKGGMARESCH